MNIIDVMNGDNISIDGVTTNKVAHYNGEYVTCYPGSNQKDDGKLHLEFNMARFVTRLSSKNFCIVKPSFTLNLVVDQISGTPQVEIGPGQASINGMDLIVTEQMYLNPPVTPGTYYIALRLGRDSSSNVLGDTVIGVLTRFDGVYLAYWDEKEDPINTDMLYLGKVTWSGTAFSGLEEDEDKYGRIWADDVLGKFLDPKHPDTRRLTIQELIYNLPDWYFSKEGDTVYGPILISDDRENGNTGILMNVDETGSYITIKNPTEDNSYLQIYGDVDRDGTVTQLDYDMIEAYINGTGSLTDLQIHLADLNHDGVVDEQDLKYIQNYLDYQDYLDSLLPGERAKTPIEMDLNFGDLGNVYYIDNTINQINVIANSNVKRIEMDKASLFVNKTVDGSFHIHNDGDICIDAEGNVDVQADNRITLSTESGTSPVLALDNDEVKITDPDYPDLSFRYRMYTSSASNIAEYQMGAAIWRYTYTSGIGGGRVSLLDQNVLYLDVVPDADFSKKVRVQDAIYVGHNAAYAGEKTYIKPEELRVGNTTTNAINTIVKPGKVTINTNRDGLDIDTSNPPFSITTNGGISYTNIYEAGVISLANRSNGNVTPFIVLTDSTNGTVIQKIRGENAIGLKQEGVAGYTTTLKCGMIVSTDRICVPNGVYLSSSSSGSPNITAGGVGNAWVVTSGAMMVGSEGKNSFKAGPTVLTSQAATPSQGQALTVNGISTFNGDINGTANININGTIRGTKVYNAVYNDYAEVFRKDKEELLEPGDVVYVGQDGLVHKVQSSDNINAVIGIVSDTYGVLLGGDKIPEEEQVKVGLVGQIWTKTNDEFLTPGVMVKVQSDGTVTRTNNRTEKFGITLTGIENGKVKIIFNG